MWRAPLIVGVVLLLLAGLTFADAFRLAVSTGPGVGPSVAMKLVAALLTVLGVAHLVQAWRKRGEQQQAPHQGEKGNPRALAWVLGGLIVQIAALAFGAGFVVSSTILFVATARGFGRSLKSLGPVYGLVLSIAVYVFFTKALSLSLPAGPLEKLLLG
ncbi:tripartite tricarboxylate transporter TctB family protein [Noviherbaspirillum cavernae]|uniref:tripartite tricarboxylate transporter TctB family protein n=1 Tax=Noviherbaspirillum cavernae TaxID=2320862 RepID=UPI001F5B20D6|nr:tripartite tricarboxylate transporter TctB family protein [Noviherbaspirillum cavernae]